ncbi:PglZ domain-containing protein [Sorangium sp. So ce295]|uniref:PglZ domain-containing protein n=1 Tax=Sorangium sp. So ce295 TaxID=3133295 RepID=UPI003F647338
MHPLHKYIAKQIASRLDARRVVVLYDPRFELVPFVRELRGAEPSARPSPVCVGGVDAHLVEHAGSLFEVRFAVEPLVAGDEPEKVLIYLAGVTRDHNGSVFMELEKAGVSYEPSLKQLARSVLRERYTDGIIDDILRPDRVTYEDLVRALSDKRGSEPPSVLKAIFHEHSGFAALIAAWVASDARDSEIETKEAKRELVKLLRVKLGLTLGEGEPLAKLRKIVQRHVLACEFRADLRCPPPSTLDSVPAPANETLDAVQKVTRRLRAAHEDTYAGIADEVEKELGLASAQLPAAALGSTDTFRFEERALLQHAGELIAAGKYTEALAIIGEREGSYWLVRDVARKTHWEACRRMADLGTIAAEVRAAARDEARKGAMGVQGWVERYATKNGWQRLDQAQRRLEAWVSTLTEEPDERPLGLVRRAYDDACAALADGFSQALAAAQWSVPGILHQTRIHADVVAHQPSPVAYFLVDAMRFEMGIELAERLPASAEVITRSAIAALPSITPVGMAALLPGASSSFSVVEQGGKLGAKIDDSFLPDLASRKKLALARAPGMIDISLDDVLNMPPSKLAKKVEGAPLVIVRSQEIDHAGEAGFTSQARLVMNNVIDNLRRAIRKLAGAGIEHAVVTADHGHIFSTERDESMRIDSPGGQAVEQHRRCWIGRGGSTPYGSRRARGAELGYESDLDFVFPTGAGVFKGGGDLAFHHGGTSLQEMVIPVVTVRLKLKPSNRPTAGPISVTDVPEAVTNRIFRATLHLGGKNLDLFGSTSMSVRPLLVHDGKQVGKVGMVTDAELERAGDCVKLAASKPATVFFLLSDDTVPSLRVIVQDPITDAELWRSPIIPVKLMT